MAYEAELAALISQLGTTEVEVNLIDRDRVMPPKRLSASLPTEKPTERDIETILSDLITLAIEKFVEEQLEQVRLNKEKFDLDSFVVWVGDKVVVAIAQIGSDLRSSDLTSEQKELGLRVLGALLTVKNSVESEPLTAKEFSRARKN